MRGKRTELPTTMKRSCVLRQTICSIDMWLCVWAKLVLPVFRPLNGSSTFPREALMEDYSVVAFIPSSPCGFRAKFEPIEERHVHHSERY